MVSTTVCGTVGTGSIPVRHPRKLHMSNAPSSNGKKSDSDSANLRSSRSGASKCQNKCHPDYSAKKCTGCSRTFEEINQAYMESKLSR